MTSRGIKRPKPAKRARRRGDRERMKAKARRIRPWDEQGRLADHLAVCSCLGCGNPRRHVPGTKGLTLQERRQNQPDPDF
jgi:hypothetical protein